MAFGQGSSRNGRHQRWVGRLTIGLALSAPRPPRLAAGLLLAAGATILLLSTSAAAHRSGRHMAHACLSDHHTYVWRYGGRSYSCAAPAAREYDPARDTVRIRYGGRTYFCRLVGSAAPERWRVQPLAASIPEHPFQLTLDRKPLASTRLVAIAARVRATARFPQVLVIAASGYLRLKAGADPRPPLPFGQSLVLGPAIFATATSFAGPARLFFHPQLQRVEIAHARDGSLHIHIEALDRDLAASSTVTNQIMNLRWNLVLHRPSSGQTRLDVHGSYTFTKRVVPDPARTAELQSFRLVQISSMYIDPQRHDVNAIRYRATAGPVSLALSPALTGMLLPMSPAALAPGRRVLDIVHTDDVGLPNGNTPSYRIAFATVQGPASGPLTPRAFITPSQDLNDDNLGVWVHQRPPAVFPRGAHGVIAYTALATTNPLRRP